MAKRATTRKGSDSPKSKKGSAKRTSSKRAGGTKRAGQGSASDAFIKLLQSPLVADLVAVAATTALAALAEEGFGRGGGGKKAGKAVKKAGKAAAQAVGRRLSTEIEEIRKAAKSAKADAKG